MNRNHLKISTFVVLCSLAWFGFILGCKNAANPLGPYDVPTATSTITTTSTITSTPTSTSTPGAVNVTVNVNYAGNAKTGITFDLVDPSGNTITTTTNNTLYSFNPSVYGNYSVNIPTQSIYAYSQSLLNIPGPGNYSVAFSNGTPSLTVNPTTYFYQSAIGYSLPMTISYTSTGNLNVPAYISVSGLPSAFGIQPSVPVIQANTSSAVTFFRNACYVSNFSIQFAAQDSSSGPLGISTLLQVERGYTIPVTVFYSYNAAMTHVSCIGAIGAISIIFNVFDQGLNCSSYEPYSFYGSGNADTNCCTGSVQFDGVSGVSAFPFGEAFPVTAVIQISGAEAGATSCGFSIPVSFGYPGGQINTTLSFPNVFGSASSSLGQTEFLSTIY